MTFANEALSYLYVDALIKITPFQRVELIQEMLGNFQKHGKELAQAEADMKNSHAHTNLYKADILRHDNHYRHGRAFACCSGLVSRCSVWKAHAAWCRIQSGGH